ncbi:phosphotransferase [Hazenella coriacea]|uniref:CotS family spore coat protein n=1 Tax=Hazenella coriacea TaxID=1179467 RepID=A0A4R3LG54_9BACL|nr:phosphotransferase [Hazenella coriacea]TCS96476.1 CotS family spore coat protein [Hazenella coriacea]
MKQPHPYLMEKILHTSVRNMTPYRKNWCIETDQHKWIAKRVNNSDNLRWWIKVDQEMRQRGFHSMPIIRSDGKSWLCTPFIEGKTGNYANMEEVKRMIGVLAHFHLAGRGLTTPPEKGAAFLLYHRLHERLVQFYQLMKKVDSIPGELGVFLKRYGRDFYLDGYQTWQQIEKLPLQKIAHEERFLRNLTHRDLASHNWIISPNHQPWLIDFETADYDSQLGDVWQISSRILSENNWSDEWSEFVLLSYESYRPFTSLEKRIIYNLLSFPNEFFREAIGLAKKKRGYQMKYTFPYLQKLVNQRNQWQLQLKRIFYW